MVRSYVFQDVIHGVDADFSHPGRISRGKISKTAPVQRSPAKWTSANKRQQISIIKKTKGIGDYRGVSQNKGVYPPQIIHLFIGFFIIFTIHFGGFPPIFGNTHRTTGWDSQSTNHQITKTAGIFFFWFMGLVHVPASYVSWSRSVVKHST